MHERVFEYSIVRAVPRIERGEFVNVGVIVFCATERLLVCRTAVDPIRLRAIDPDAPVEAIRRHLAAFETVCRGGEGGPVARLPPGERFHWLVGPRSAILQTSPVHAGRTHDLELVLDRLFLRLVVT